MGRVLAFGKVLWWLLVAAAVIVAMLQVPYWIGMPAGLFVFVWATTRWEWN